MTFIFTASKDVVDAVVKSANDKTLGKHRNITIDKVSHYNGYSTCQVNCKGELSDLIWLGYWAHYLTPSPTKSLMA